MVEAVLLKNYLSVHYIFFGVRSTAILPHMYIYGIYFAMINLKLIIRNLKTKCKWIFSEYIYNFTAIRIKVRTRSVTLSLTTKQHRNNRQPNRTGPVLPSPPPPPSTAFTWRDVRILRISEKASAMWRVHL